MKNNKISPAQRKQLDYFNKMALELGYEAPPVSDVSKILIFEGYFTYVGKVRIISGQVRYMIKKSLQTLKRISLQT